MASELKPISSVFDLKLFIFEYDSYIDLQKRIIKLWNQFV